MVDMTIQHGPREAASYALHMETFRDEMLKEEAYEDQKEHIWSTEKPKGMKAKEWVRRMKVINSYLPYMQHGGAKFSNAQLVKHCVAPNVPKSWKKDFRIGRGHLLTSVGSQQHFEKH